MLLPRPEFDKDPDLKISLAVEIRELKVLPKAVLCPEIDEPKIEGRLSDLITIAFLRPKGSFFISKA
jgi:hypothetical protein